MKARTCACLLAVAAGLPVSCESTESGVRVVKVPRSPFFVFGREKSVEELDRVFRDLKAGDELRLELEFPGHYRQTLESGPIMVRKGSLTVHTAEGYFKVFPEGRVLAKTAKLPAREFMFDDAQPGFWLWAMGPGKKRAERPLVTLGLQETSFVEQSPSRKMNEAGYNDQALPPRDSTGWRVGMTIQTSPDFEGSVAGWKVGPVGK